MSPIPCLRLEELQAYLLGDLPEEQAQAVAAHLECCATCEAEAGKWDGHADPVLQSLRRALDCPAPTTALNSSPGDSTPDGPHRAPGSSPAPRWVDSYEVLGELGRGGMSVVYQARQARPARLVALKMILAGSHAGPELRARFLAEADAIARLQHPNIVQVFEVGVADDALYFSMELVEGGSLHHKLAGAPQPANLAASVVEAVARAAQYAHERGIVHRDLKPGNILLTSEGTPKIADFGLARQDPDKPQGAEAGAPGASFRGRNLTVTGAVLGTPGYMAPEQALGKGATIGPAADVYALGAILYEMLTGRPPFLGTSVLETLEMVRTQEPVPPSRLQPRLPRDLETICLKCLAKEPASRYASALALADDLRRFQSGRPIRARPVPIYEKAWKAARRRPLVTASLALAILALGSLLAAWTWFTLRLQAERNRANANAHQADLERSRAEVNEDRAFEAIDRFLTRIADQKLAAIPGLEEVRRDLLLDALKVSQAFLAEKQSDASPRVRKEVAQAHLRCSRIQIALKNKAGQLEHLHEAVRLNRQLVEDFPDESSYRTALALTLHNLGISLPAGKGPNPLEQGEALLKEALQMRRQLVAETADPEASFNLASTHLALNQMHRSQPGRQHDAEQAGKDALAILEAMPASVHNSARYRHQLANLCVSLGVQHYTRGNMTQSKDYQERARELYRAQRQSEPGDEKALGGLAMVSNNLGAVYLELKQPALALKAGQEALQGYEEIARLHRALPGPRGGLAGAYNNLARVYERIGNPQEAEQLHRAACREYRELVRDYPTELDVKLELARNLTNLGDVLQLHGKPAEAVAPCREAVDILEPLVPADCQDPSLELALGHAELSLAFLELSLQGPEPGVRQRLDKAIEVLETLLKQQKGHHEGRSYLLKALRSQAIAFFLAGSWSEALATWEKAARTAGPPDALSRQLRALALAHTGSWSQALAEARPLIPPVGSKLGPEESYRLACIEARCAEAIAQDGRLSPEERQRQEIECENRAVDQLQRLASTNGLLPVEVRMWPPEARVDIAWKLVLPDVQTPRFAFLLARAHARAAATQSDKSGPLEERALEALVRAGSLGYFQTAEGRRRLSMEPDLKRLHRLPAFQALLSDAATGREDCR